MFEIYNYFPSLQVLIEWRNMQEGCRIETFVNALLEWQKSGYVSVDVWTDMKRLLNEKVLPSI